MHSVRQISDKLYYIGVNDRRLELFENLFPIPHGVSYNSYLLMDEKTVLFDTVDHSGSAQFIENLEYVLAGRTLDYIVVNHVEPDHAASLKDIIAKYENVQIVGNAKTFTFIEQFFGSKVNQHLVKEGDILETGEHKLTFVMASMVHWPEVMVTYDITSKVLFSADAYGTFKALDGGIFADEYGGFEDKFLKEARRYYTNIVGKYGLQTQKLLTKAKGLEIDIICPLHGPVLRGEDIGFFTEKQSTWSSYTPENPDDIFICYASMYGNTESVVNALAMKLAENGKKVSVMNACNTDTSYLIAEAFRCGKIVLASPTYNADLHPAMKTFTEDLKAIALRNRELYVIENGSWAAAVAKKIKEVADSMKNMEVKAVLSIKSSKVDEQAFQEFANQI